MKKNYGYAAALLILALLLWLGVSLYMEYRPEKSHNGTFVKLPELVSEERKLSA